MTDNHQAPVAVAAAASADCDNTKDDATIAKCLQAVETLTTMFNFDTEVASQAVDAVGPDVTMCYNYILDQSLSKDHGGAVYPIDNCPHLSRHLKMKVEQIKKDFVKLPCRGGSSATGAPKGETQEDGSCPLGENWMCLECSQVFCSRYVNGHCVQHWKDTKSENNEEGHCVAVSFADLSVWCHECQSYIRHKSLHPFLECLEVFKFNPFEDHSSHNFDNDDYEYSIVDDPSSSIRKLNTEDDFDRRPPKKQRSISSMSSASENNTISSNSSGGNNSIPSDGDYDEDFDPDTNIRSFPISLDDVEEDAIQYPFTLPKSLKEVAEFINSDKCRKIIILAGAGMSVVSGIPDFRSANGLYATMNPDTLTATQSEKDLIRLDPSVALDNRLFLQNQLPCLEVNRQFLLGTKDQVWKATLAHRFVELLHKKAGKLGRLYTQNIDGLEDQCTSLPRDKIVNVHGTMDQAECGMCRNSADFETFCQNVRTNIKDITGTDPTAPSQSQPIPCDICGYNALKPAIVLFKSNLPQRFFELVPRDIENADLLLILGTSLKVAPANSLVYRVPKTCMRVVINRDPVGIQLGMQYGNFAERDYLASGDIDHTVLDLMGHLGWLDELQPLLEGDHLPEPSADLLRQKFNSQRSDMC